MTKRTLTIRLKANWRASLREAGRKAKAKTYQGEERHFETAGMFFGKLSERRWEMVRALQGQGVMSIQELPRRLERDIKRVHENVGTLIGLDLVERETAGLACPVDRIHVDIELAAVA